MCFSRKAAIDRADTPALLAGLAGLNDAIETKQHWGLDLNRVLLSRARKLIFDPQAVAVEKEAAENTSR